jgi:DNA replication and repair protein RecF
VFINGKNVSVYGSQGQKRSSIISLKLAEAEMFKNRFGEYPIVILDDVLSELDLKRQKKLSSSLNDMQAVFTCTEFSKAKFSGKNVNRIKIENGKIKK